MIKMKFKSQKDLFMKILTFGFSGLLMALFIFMLIVTEHLSIQVLLIYSIILIPVGLLFWIYFGTVYTLTHTHLEYKSGPVSGTMEIKKITEIIIGQNRYTSIRPATAKNGMIVKVGIYDEVYISPKTNDSFIAKILELNDQIIVTKK